MQVYMNATSCVYTGDGDHMNPNPISFETDRHKIGVRRKMAFA